MNKKLLLVLVLFVCLKSFSQQESRNETLLFPNTASSQVNLLLPESVKPTDISVYDLNGRLIKKIALRNSSHYSIDTQSFPEGMYVVAISTPDETKIKKFVIDPNAINDFGYYDNSSNEEFNVVSLVGNSSGTTDLTPIDDAYLQGATRYNTTNVRVDGGTRTTYLKYDLSSLQGKVSSAALKFTIASDPGSGTISVYKGNGTNWTEENLSTSNRPSRGALLGTINKTYGTGSTHTISLNASDLGGSLLSLVVVHSNGNDTDFASKENSTFDPPTLVFSFDDSGNNDNTGGTNGNASGITLSPKDDAYLQGSTRYNTTNVRVEAVHVPPI